MLRYHSIVHSASTADFPTASLAVVLGPVPIKEFEQCSILYSNSSTTVTIVSMTLEVANQSMQPDNADTQAWVTIGSGVIPVPSSVQSRSNAITPPFYNAYGWIRIKARGSVSAATSGMLSITIGGHRRV